VLGQTRILPQALEATWEKLAAAAAGLPGPKQNPATQR
jgi:hypothetical protein